MFLLQGIVLTQGSNPCLLHWQEDSLPLSSQGSQVFSFTSFRFYYVEFIECDLQDIGYLVVSESCFAALRLP